MANKYFLKCSISFTTREIQIRDMLKFHPVLIQIAKTKLRKRKRNDSEQSSGFEQKGTFARSVLEEMQNCTSLCGNWCRC